MGSAAKTLTKLFRMKVFLIFMLLELVSVSHTGPLIHGSWRTGVSVEMGRMAQTAPVECSKEIVIVMRSVRVLFIAGLITANSLMREPMNWLTAAHLLLSDYL